MKIIRTLTLVALFALSALTLGAQEKTLINNDWTFALGNAASMEKDFTHGTEYFTYFTKFQSHFGNNGPASTKFDDSAWQKVNLPHDWVVDRPYSGEASHSHGYKTIGYKYPETSVGWYRKRLFIPEEDRGKNISLEFEGIFRDSEVFCNGAYLGHERSGYAYKYYDITDCINFGAENIITVRCNASTEEGWFYEGAGIYRNVYLHKSGPVSLKPYTLFIRKGDDGKLLVNAELDHYNVDDKDVSWSVRILDAEGKPALNDGLKSRYQGDKIALSLNCDDARRWDLDDPYLYTLQLKVYCKSELSAEYNEKFGVRDIEFNPERGFLLNGKRVEMLGADLHIDHAGVGVAVPAELFRYRINELKKYGFNTIRSSHNPMAPDMLRLCDELGMLVIDENRNFGPNEEQMGQMENMITHDWNHPCIVLWSIGNEEWAVENSPWGTAIALRMSDRVHKLDPTRPSTYGCGGGQAPNYGVDVFGYNYIRQNPILENKTKYPEKTGLATEETTGCGTRGKYETVREEGWMASINRKGEGRIRREGDKLAYNVIERGWKFYHEKEWLCGICYWTGFDYRGEPNPMSWPATGSQFGILDYCGFPKDEAFYLQSWWTDKPVLHICGPCDGEVWVYSNCETVQLFADGKSLGKQKMEADGHLVWKVPEKAKSFTAKGFSKGRKTITDSYPEVLEGTTLTLSKGNLVRDGQDVVIIDIASPEETLEVSVDGARFLGWGNGNPGFKEVERPLGSDSMTIKPFCGRAQVIVRSIEGKEGPVTVKIGGEQVVLK